MKHSAIFLFQLVAGVAFAGDYIPLPSTNAIVLRFDGSIPAETENAIREDYQYCLSASVSDLELYHFDQDPTNTMSLSGCWQPYGCSAATSRLGPHLPEDGIFSNGIFTIDVPYAFATNYQRHVESTAAYSNEIAAAYTFIEALSPANLAVMPTNEMQSLNLWKDAQPGQLPSTVDLEYAVSYYRKSRVFPPPRAAFFVWDCGPTNSPPYLWCHVPAIDTIGSRTIVLFEMMVFFQNRWWLSSWPFLEREQQW